MGIPAVIEKTMDSSARQLADKELAGKRRELEPTPYFVDLSQHPWASQRPAYWVYIYNTVDRKFERTRPPHFPNIVIPPCPKEQRYILAMRVPAVMNTRDERKDTFEIVINADYGARFAADLVNPQNLTAEMWSRVDPKAPHAYINADGGDDLGRRGVFWTTKVYCENCNALVTVIATDIEMRIESIPGEGSRPVEYCVKCHKPFHAKPGDDELRKSSELVRAFCQSRIEACGRIAADPRSPEIIGPEDHWCADHLQVSPQWHTHMAVPSICEDCGGPLKGDPMFHKNDELGVICVRHGQEGWKKAVASGVKRYEEVPEEFVWREVAGGEEAPIKRGPGRPPKIQD
jgi:hypothetical protein